MFGGLVYFAYFILPGLVTGVFCAVVCGRVVPGLVDFARGLEL